MSLRKMIYGQFYLKLYLGDLLQLIFYYTHHFAVITFEKIAKCY